MAKTWKGERGDGCVPSPFRRMVALKIRRVSDCLTSVRPSRGVCGPQSDVSILARWGNGREQIKSNIRVDTAAANPRSHKIKLSTSEQGKNGATLAAPSPISTGESTLPLLTRCKCRVLPFWPSTSTRSHLIKLDGINANILTHDSLYSMAAQKANSNPAVNSTATDTTPLCGQSNCQILFLSHKSQSTIG